MRKIILWMASIVSGVLCASEIYVGSGETKIITVPSGSEKVQCWWVAHLSALAWLFLFSCWAI
jgi:hypothetical protein